MLKDCNLDLRFFTPNSLVFRVISDKDIEIHIHIGNYQTMYITIIISDKYFTLDQDEKSLDYINTVFWELEMKLSLFFGFFEKGRNIETFLHINFNNIRLDFLPFFMHDEEYKDIKSSLSSIILEKIKEM